MPRVLIYALEGLPEVLKKTLLWRDDVERQIVHQAQDVLTRAVPPLPNLLLIDGKAPGGERLVQELRANAATRGLSIAVLARGEFSPNELGLMAAGANAILRLPVDRDWDDRLATLMSVAPRRAARLAVSLQFEAEGGYEVQTVAGTVLNLSERGMLVETDAALGVGTDIDFKIHLQDRPAPLAGRGHVIRQQAMNRCGVQFYGLEPDGLERVRRFVKK